MAPTPPRRQTPATAGLARRLYAEGVPIAEICTRTGLSTGAAYRWIDREVDPDGTVRVAPLGRRAAKTGPAKTRSAKTRSAKTRPAKRRRAKARTGTAESRAGALQAPAAADARKPAAKAHGPDAPPPRARLIARLWRAAERQVADIEARIRGAASGAGAAPRPAADAEKDARALALLARTLRELAAAEDEVRNGTARDNAATGDADDTVRDLDAFRRELARRLERLRADDAGAGDPLPS